MLKLEPVFGLKSKLCKAISGKGEMRLSKPKVEREDGKLTVLSLYDGKNLLGTLRTKNQRQSQRYLDSRNVNLLLRYDEKHTRHIFAVV